MATDAKKETAALMLSSGLSAVRVAKQIGVTPETVSRWKMSPDFQALINEYQTERLTLAREELRTASQKAVETINALMDSQSEGIRLKASISILRFCNFDQPQRLFSGIGSTDPLEILAELKQQVEAERHIFESRASLR